MYEINEEEPCHHSPKKNFHFRWSKPTLVICTTTNPPSQLTDVAAAAPRVLQPRELTCQTVKSQRLGKLDHCKGGGGGRTSALYTHGTVPNPRPKNTWYKMIMDVATLPIFQHIVDCVSSGLVMNQNKPSRQITGDTHNLLLCLIVFRHPEAQSCDQEDDSDAKRRVHQHPIIDTLARMKKMGILKQPAGLGRGGGGDSLATSTTVNEHDAHDTAKHVHCSARRRNKPTHLLVVSHKVLEQSGKVEAYMSGGEFGKSALLSRRNCHLLFAQ